MPQNSKEKPKDHACYWFDLETLGFLTAYTQKLHIGGECSCNSRCINDPKLHMMLFIWPILFMEKVCNCISKYANRIVSQLIYLYLIPIE